MKSQVLEQVDKCKVKLRLEFDSKESGKAYGITAKEIAKEAKIDGFPKGKIPTSVIEQRVGKDQLQNEALNYLLRENLDAAVAQAELEILSSPTFENSNRDFDNNLEIDLLVETRPEVKIAEYKNLKFEVPELTQEDFDVNKELELLARQFAQPEKIEDSGLEEFDIVKMDCIGKFTDGSEMPNAEMKDHVTEVVKERLAPGILDQILGMKVDEEKDVTVSFPADYEDSDFAGKEAQYSVKIHTISRRTPLEINDELAAKAGFENLDDLKVDLEKNSERTNKQFNDNRAKLFILSDIISKTEIDLPDWLIERSAEQEVRQRVQNDAEAKDKDPKELITDEDKAAGKEKIMHAFVLQEIAKTEKIEVTQQEFEQGVQQFYQMLQMFNPQAQISQDMLYMVREQVSMEKIINWLLENSEITYTSGNADLQKQLDKLAKDYEYLNLTIKPM